MTSVFPHFICMAQYEKCVLVALSSAPSRRIAKVTIVFCLSFCILVTKVLHLQQESEILNIFWLVSRRCFFFPTMMMGIMISLTFLWLKLLIVKKPGFALCIFSICVMFSLVL